MIYEDKTKTVCYHFWEFYTITQIIDTVKFYSPKTLILNSAPECNIYLVSNWKSPELLELDNICKSLGTKVIILLGSYSNNKDYIYYPQNIFPDWEFKYYPLYFLDYIEKGAYNPSYVDKMLPHPVNYKHHFFSYNNNPHVHRCMFLDMWFKYDLNKFGDYTWNLPLKEEPRPYDQDLPYKFEWFNDKFKGDGSKFNETKNPHLWPSDKYINSIFDIVTETTNECVFFTEKTFRPILLNKAFILYSHANSHKRLRELGFKTFEPIVDYSFDEELDDKKRADLLCKELKKIGHLDLEYIIETIQPIVKYNRRIVTNILKPDSTPKGFLEKHIPQINLY
jgi:hypothetical protein